MSVARWTVTASVLAGAAWALALLGPPADGFAQALTAPQLLLDTAGPDALLVPLAAAAGWACWGWGVLGLLLTVGSTLPGAAGHAAGWALRALLPAGARRLAAVAVGLSLGAGPVAVLAAPAPAPVALHTAAADVPLDPAPTTGTPPDWPAATGRVVLRGDCLWDIAAGWLTARGPAGSHPTDSEVASAVHAWWRANAAVIGDDPDLLLPGQVLTPPG